MADAHHFRLDQHTSASDKLGHGCRWHFLPDMAQLEKDLLESTLNQPDQNLSTTKGHTYAYEKRTFNNCSLAGAAMLASPFRLPHFDTRHRPRRGLLAQTRLEVRIGN